MVGDEDEGVQEVADDVVEHGAVGEAPVPTVFACIFNLFFHGDLDGLMHICIYEKKKWKR